MKFGHLPGGPPQRQRGSRARIIASHLLSPFRRRIRSRLLLLLIALFGILFIVHGRRHSTELHLTASTPTTYISTGISSAIATYGETENQDTRWEDTKASGKAESNHIVLKKPRFHLLIPAHKPSAALCRTLLSAAILYYPPPTLIGYGISPAGEKRSGDDVVKRTFSFLTGKQVKDDDLVMVVSEDTIFQLPATITLTRFFSTLHTSSNTLLTKYGRVPNADGSSKPQTQCPQRYTPKILFSASKSCSHSPDSQVCQSILDSPLPYAFTTSTSKPRTSEGKDNPATTNPPQYLGASLHIGRASPLISLYKRAIGLLELPNSDTSKNEPAHTSQHVFEKLFSEQEQARLLFLAEERAKRPAWRNWLADIFFSSSEENGAGERIIKVNEAEVEEEDKDQQKDGESEFGITLDYSNSLFQNLKNSAQDLQFVTFGEQEDGSKNQNAAGGGSSVPSRIEGKSKTWRESKDPIRLPIDLSNAPGPFSGMDVSTVNSNPASNPNQRTPPSNEPSWSTIPLLTNTATPFLSVPAAINFHGTELQTSEIDELWNGLWFHNSSRRLLVQQVQIKTANPNPEALVISLSSPASTSGTSPGLDDSESDSDSAINGDSDLNQDAVHYLDVRPGKTPLGTWTDEGKWVSWKSLCGGYGESVFGDGLGEGVGEFDLGGEGKEEAGEDAHGKGKGEGGIGGVGEWVEEGEGFVKGLWGMVVGDGDGDDKTGGEEKEKVNEKEKEEEEGKESEKSAGSGGEGLEGGFEQFVGLVESKEEDGEGGNVNKNEPEVLADKAKGGQEQQEQKQKAAEQQHGGIRDDDRTEGGKEEDRKHEPKPEADDHGKDNEDKNDDQKNEVEDNERLKGHDGHADTKPKEEGKDDEGKAEEGKVEEGVVRYVDENGEENIEKMQKEEEQEDQKDGEKHDGKTETEAEERA